MDCESGQSLAEPRSELKVLVGQKRGISEVEKTFESSDKRVKLQDQESVLCTESQVEKEVISTCHPDENANSRTLDENVGSVNDKEETERRTAFGESKEFDLDLNAEESFCPGKNYEILKSMDDSECESSIGPFDEKDSMRVWKGLKQNNFMSNPHGTITVPTAIPKPRAKKKNTDSTKKKIELAKKEQVDRFARVAAPSGLLNGLNPGIINHVRNSKQVHSIIEALVKSERAEIEKQRRGKNQVGEAKNGTRFGHGEGLQGKRQVGDYSFFSRPVILNNGISKGNGNPYETENGKGVASQYDVEKENDILTLKLSSSENASCLSNEESGNYSSVNSLPIKAANVASQWLELLTQDIKGRLAALRQSKNRVQTVITTELPFLISREFSSNSSKATVESHSLKWNTLFGQMENTLSEEENHLESWLNQVMEMQRYCDKGSYKSSLLNNAPQLMGSTGNNNRLGEVDNVENNLAIRAAAASIYSTCNFLLSMENPPCS